MYNWSFLFVVLHKPTLLTSTFNKQIKELWGVGLNIIAFVIPIHILYSSALCCSNICVHTLHLYQLIVFSAFVFYRYCTFALILVSFFILFYSIKEINSKLNLNSNKPPPPPKKKGGEEKEKREP